MGIKCKPRPRSSAWEANVLKPLHHPYRFTTYQDARRVRLVDGLEYLEQIVYEYHPLNLRRDVTALNFYYSILIVIVCLEVEPKMTNLVYHKFSQYFD